MVVGRKGTVGSLYWEDHPLFPIDTVFYVVPRIRSALFIYHLLLTQPLRDMNTDAAVPGLNRGNVYRLQFSYPALELIGAFENGIRDFWKLRATNLKEIEVLTQIRDTLLPKLISGEIRLTEAENALQNPDLVGQILKSPKSVVIVGLSTDEQKDSHVVAKFLQSKGIRIIPVHPQADLILGEKVYRRVADITEKVDIVNVFRPSHECPQYAEQAVQIGARVLWLQLGIFSEEAAEIAREAGMAVIMNLCIKVEYNRHYASITSSE